MNYYLGMDIGGTFIKGVLVDQRGKVIADGKAPTGCADGGDAMSANIAALCSDLQGKAAVKACAVGVGCAGMISDDGTVLFAGNLGLKNYPLAQRLSELTG
ncbi:MAG: ROK family protein, partial [Clostridia bacterium]|nr:ROK family protein [Clostridia bacterium]